MEFTFSDRIDKLQPSAIREILKMSQDPNIIPFSAGNPAPEAFPVDAVREISARVLADTPILALQYGVTDGYAPLKATLKSFVKENYGIGRDFDELVVVSGATQGIELTAKVLCNEHDTIICEGPSFIGSLNAFRSYNTHLVGVPLEEDGMNMEILEEELKKNKNTKFIYVIPNFQNPTGKCMSLAKRKELYNLACKYNVMILEDNPYGDLRFAGEDIPAIKSFDEEGRVIYVGSFSKVLSPGMRVGYLIAPSKLVNKIVVAKQAQDVHTNVWSQIICDEFMNKYDFKAHLQGLKKIYGERAELILGEMDKKLAGKVKYTRPQGGLFIYVTLPDEIDMVDFCKRAIVDKAVAAVPGNTFLVNENEVCHDFRINFSTPTKEQLVEGISRLAEML